MADQLSTSIANLDLANHFLKDKTQETKFREALLTASTSIDENVIKTAQSSLESVVSKLTQTEALAIAKKSTLFNI
jgi:hypothetical protein